MTEIYLWSLVVVVVVGGDGGGGGGGGVGREKRESTKLDYERKVKTLLKMLERANKWFGPDFRKSNLLVRR